MTRTFVTLFVLILVWEQSPVLAQEKEGSAGKKSSETKSSNLEKKFEKNSLFPKLMKGDFVVIGIVSKYQFKETPPAGKRESAFFHSFTFKPTGQLRGDYLAAVDRSFESAKRKRTANWRASAMMVTQSELDKSVTKEGEPCIFVLQRMRASTMAGNVPVRLLSVCPANSENIKIAKAATAKLEKSQKEKSKKSVK